MSLESRIHQYLKTLLGHPPQLRPVGEGPLGDLPFYLRKLYDFRRVAVDGRTVVLALRQDDDPNLTAPDYEREWARISQAFQEPVVLGLARLPSTVRNRLVHKGVAFIVPDRQLYFPRILLDLRERQAVRRPSTGRFAPATQHLLLLHLLAGEVEGQPYQALASRLGYTSMTISNAAKDLEAASLATSRREGRSKRLEFALPPRELWARCSDQLATPVVACHWLARWPEGHVKLHAGLSALSRYSSLSDDPVPTFAIDRSSFDPSRGDAKANFLPDSGGAGARLEFWTYDPAVLARGDRVDPLSLYLSLRDSADERVQSALDQMIEALPW